MESTKYAPAKMLHKEEMKSHYKAFMKLPFLHEILDLLPQVAFILSGERQVLIANKAVLSLFGSQAITDVFSQRLGEIFHCIHAQEEMGGCGTSSSCKVCGVIHAILESQKHHCPISTMAEITSEVEGERTIRHLIVTASPLDHNGQNLTLLSMADMSNVRRRITMERLYFHDLENTSSIVDGFCNLMESSPINEQYRFVTLIREATSKLMEEMRAQRQMALAEKGELVPLMGEIAPLTELFRVKQYFRYCSERKGVEIIIADCPVKRIETDKDLLFRVLLNIVQNGLEASESGDVISMYTENEDEKITFHIQSTPPVAEKLHEKIFAKSFSTKGKGRGVGLYMAKLFVEKYMNGEIRFLSNESVGTRISVQIPLAL